MTTPDDEPGGEPDTLLGTLLAGRYRIEELIGSGGMGAVYRAEHVHMRKAVAVKVLHKEMTAFPEVVARFEREAVAAGRIDHPHVVGASDFGQLEDGSFYLVLEFVEGESLARLVSREGALAPARALGITRQITLALSAAHGVGIVHRDLKPENVMLVVKDDQPDFVKVLDFGIAKIKVEETSEQAVLTQIGTVFGTPEYMSPEQARGELVDVRSDLYTVGVILYEMLAGVSPFKDDDLVVLLTRHLTAEPPPLAADLEPMINDLVQILLRKNRTERVQSAAELLERIDLVLATLGCASSIAGVPCTDASRAGSGHRSSADLELVSARSAAAGVAPTVLGEATPPASAYGVPGESLLKRPVLLGKHAVPLWLLAASALGSVFGIALLIVVASLLFGGKSQAFTVKDDASKLAVAKDSELALLIERAESGDRAALAELAARPDSKRSPGEWHALGHGYAKLGRFPESLSAYQQAALAKRELQSDPRLLSDVRLATLDADASEAALKFAASGLGALGVDLLYDVWDSSRAVPSRALLAKQARAYLDSEPVRGQASPALKLLLDLGKAQKEGCASLKRWLSRAAQDGDARVVPALKRFDDRRGCGFLGLGDCYSCLRTNKDLGNAASSVALRPAPDFD